MWEIRSGNFKFLLYSWKINIQHTKSNQNQYILSNNRKYPEVITRFIKFLGELQNSYQKSLSVYPIYFHQNNLPLFSKTVHSENNWSKLIHSVISSYFILIYVYLTFLPQHMFDQCGQVKTMEDILNTGNEWVLRRYRNSVGVGIVKPVQWLCQGLGEREILD
jgi:hypothetical protein